METSCALAVFVSGGDYVANSPVTSRYVVSS